MTDHAVTSLSPGRLEVPDSANERRSEMGKIVITENVSLDGVVQDPTGEEGFRHGGWFAQVGDKDREERAKVVLDEALGAEAFLLGRRSYEFLAARWPSRNGRTRGQVEQPAQVR